MSKVGYEKIFGGFSSVREIIEDPKFIEMTLSKDFNEA